MKKKNKILLNNYLRELILKIKEVCSNLCLPLIVEKNRVQINLHKSKKVEFKDWVKVLLKNNKELFYVRRVQML